MPYTGFNMPDGCSNRDLDPKPEVDYDDYDDRDDEEEEVGHD